MRKKRDVASEVEFVGELSIRTAIASHQKLMLALAEPGEIQLSVDPDADVDLTFVQLVEAARRMAREEGRGLSLARPAAGRLREVLERGGFLGAPDRRAFWLMEKEA
jgi:hypothetical protein